MRLTRAEVIDSNEINIVHVYNRTVRRCFLMGHDQVSGKNFDHRKIWIEKYLQQFAASFGIDLLCFTILSNHFHLILRTRPDVVETWDDTEVAQRWMMICPHRKRDDGTPLPPSEAELNLIRNCPIRLATIRSRLSREASQKLLEVERWSPGGQNLPSATFKLSSVVTDGETIMNEANLLQALGQVSASETGKIFREFLRGHVREMISEVMAVEVTQLCGVKHSRSESDHHRAGSSPGRILYEGEREDIIRPRVRRTDADGSSQEVELASYRVAKDPQQLQAQVIQAIMSGVSTREVESIKPNSPGVSRSSASRLWQDAGSKFIDDLRGKDLTTQTWCVLMLDGIRLSKDQFAVAAIGIDHQGHKHVLDFALGSSESLAVSRELVGRLVSRGFKCDHRLFTLLDGSDALRGAVKEFFPDSVIQRCLVHKERNIRGKLSKRHWGELARLFKRLRSVQGYAAAQEVFAELESFLKPINAEAFKSLHEAGEDLLALHRLDVPNTLHRSLLSTNAIENTFLNTRRKLGRVTRFRVETDQASRWLSYALLEAEKGYRRISGYTDLPLLIAALQQVKETA